MSQSLVRPSFLLCVLVVDEECFFLLRLLSASLGGGFLPEGHTSGATIIP